MKFRMVSRWKLQQREEQQRDLRDAKGRLPPDIVTNAHRLSVGLKR
jgi:hypothetical protein